MNTTAKVILGVSVAAAAGVVAGMLLAPEKGSDTQKKIRETARDWVNEFLAILSTSKEAAASVTKKAIEATDELTKPRISKSSTANN
jgi:gas vesicle protein